MEPEVLEIQKLQMTAIASGFEKTTVSSDGTAVWLSRPAKGDGAIQTRICIDSITRSATTFWSTDRKSYQGKTFRTSEEMQVWLTHNLKNAETLSR
jgi:hypothetical protein